MKTSHHSDHVNLPSTGHCGRSPALRDTDFGAEVQARSEHCPAASADGARHGVHRVGRRGRRGQCSPASGGFHGVSRGVAPSVLRRPRLHIQRTLPELSYPSVGTIWDYRIIRLFCTSFPIKIGWGFEVALEVMDAELTLPQSLRVLERHSKAPGIIPCQRQIRGAASQPLPVT